MLSHTAGLPNLTDISTWSERQDGMTKHGMKARRDMLFYVMKNTDPLGPPGTVQEYSNRGYGIAAAMLECVTCRSWEFLVRKYIFKPLRLKSAGFGWPATPEQPNQPLGHSVRNDRLVPHPPDTAYSIPVILAPAGDIHMSVIDFAKWTGYHLLGLQNKENNYLTKRSFDIIHQSMMEEYGLGWKIQKTSGGTVIHWHNGSGGTFYATMAIFPTMELGIVAVANAGNARAGVQRALFALANDFAGRSE